ncbi:ATPase [Heyndrickxia ginsengihumi]|uniref:ATPase n=1 Tax=Heyndrickxia ginsengihumi TaxID=363870 RepID=A0A0A6VGF1_9BACI|nr:MinD/ParA family protein [Heyndrickxia ginsengihumi]KHD86518.1 ATPase [Heyndrickxia ginsengihumi]
MGDQAEQLRAKINSMNDAKQAKTIAVVSGKGGVGKSNVSTNMAIALAKQGNKVLVFDLDIGMGNIHVLLGLNAPFSISDFIKHHMNLEEIVCSSPYQISYISAGNSFSEIMDLDGGTAMRLLDNIERLSLQYDYIIFDMGAGATASSLEILIAVDDVFVVTTPEPTAITDAYSMMKYICMKSSETQFYLICNRAEKEKEGLITLQRLQLTMEKFLQKQVSILGVLLEDSIVRKAVAKQTPFYIEFPNSAIAKKIDMLLQNYSDVVMTSFVKKERFVQKLKSLWRNNRLKVK